MPWRVVGAGSRRAVGGITGPAAGKDSADVVSGMQLLLIWAPAVGDYRRGACWKGKRCDLLGDRHRITLQKMERRFRRPSNARQGRRNSGGSELTVRCKGMTLRGMGAVTVVLLAGWMLPAGAAAQIDQNAGPVQQMPGDIDRSPGNTTNPRATNQPASMRDSLGAPGQNGQQILDKQFLRSAAEGGLAEVKISTLATEKGTSDIKDLAQKMVADHTVMNADLASVADSLGVLLPKKLNHEDQ